MHAVYCTSVDRIALPPLLRLVVDLLCSSLFLQLCRSWRDFDWHSASRGPSAVAELFVIVPQRVFDELLSTCRVPSSVDFRHYPHRTVLNSRVSAVSDRPARRSVPAKIYHFIHSLIYLYQTTKACLVIRQLSFMFLCFFRVLCFTDCLCGRGFFSDILLIYSAV